MPKKTQRSGTGNQRRHGVQMMKKQKQTRVCYRSHRSKSTDSPARSWKRNQLIAIEENDLFYLEDLDLIEDDDQTYENFTTTTNTRLKIENNCKIQDAINDNDSNLLNILLKQQRIVRNRRYKRRFPRTILTHAIDRGNIECIETILDNISSGHVYPTIIDHVCSNGRTALWYACKMGDLHLVRQLVEHGRANINKCGILIVAAQNGHENIIDYLLRKGSDPNRRIKNYNERALHAASRRNHLEIVKLLLKYGADPTILDEKKRTPLDYAIHKRHNHIAQILIDHQNGYFPSNGMGFTPFMLATHCNNIFLANQFMNILSNEQIRDEQVILACKYTIDGLVNKRDQAYSYFEKALNASNPVCSNEPCEVYEYRHECRTLDELSRLRDNDNGMRMHALIVAERILLKNENIDEIVSLLTKQSQIYQRNGLFHRCLQLRIHAYRLIIQSKLNKFNNTKLHKEKLYSLVGILLELLKNEENIPIESINFIWTSILNRADNKLTDLIIKLLFFTTHLIETKEINNKEYRILTNLIRRTMHQNVIMKDEYFLFSSYINEISKGLIGYTFANITVSASSIVRLLIQFGANVNEINPITRATPLHLIARSQYTDNTKQIVTLLLDANAHTDSRDLMGRQPEDLTKSDDMHEFLHRHQKLSLKCLCADLIHRHHIHYDDYLSSNLIRFVQMHTINSCHTIERSIHFAMDRYSSIRYNNYLRYRPIVRHRR